MKAYIVDNNPVIIMKLANTLVNAGIEVKYTLHTDSKLVKRIEDFDPDVILVGVHLGDIDGVELCSLLKMSNKIKDKPFVAISSDKELFTRLRALGGGFLDYVESPFNDESLLTKLHRYGLIGGLIKNCNKVMRGTYA